MDPTNGWDGSTTHNFTLDIGALIIYPISYFFLSFLLLITVCSFRTGLPSSISGRLAAVASLKVDIYPFLTSSNPRQLNQHRFKVGPCFCSVYLSIPCFLCFLFLFFFFFLSNLFLRPTSFLLSPLSFPDPPTIAHPLVSCPVPASDCYFTLPTTACKRERQRERESSLDSAVKEKHTTPIHGYIRLP